MKILLAIDDSHSAALPIREAATRPWPDDSVIRVLTVLEPVPPAAFIPEVPVVAYTPVDRMQLDDVEAKGMLASVAQMLAPTGLVIETVVREGDARRTIIEEAEAWGADLILMGTHGRTGLKRALMGSVAQWVVAHAKCSVEVVRGTPEERHAGM